MRTGKFPRKAALSLLLSLALLLPCWWHARIEAGDLGSHTYNAWLASLIRSGEVHGLWFSSPTTNVLFDQLLEHTTGWFGYDLGERLAVSLVVLVLFWGMFLLVASQTEEHPWYLAAVLAMLTYGWVFHMGFMNFLLATGLAAAALAFLIRDPSHGWRVALPLLALACVAHVYPVAIAVAAAAYMELARRFDWRGKAVVFAAAVIAIFAIQVVVSRYFDVVPGHTTALRALGINQLAPFGARYLWIACATVTLLWVSVLIVWWRERRTGTALVPLHFAALFSLVIVLYPSSVRPHGALVSASYLMDRISFLPLLCGCAFLAHGRVPRVAKSALVLLAVGYFALLFRDTEILTQIELEIRALALRTPPASRVVELPPYAGNTSTILDMVTRACIGHCFAYADYEPSTGQFRIRANPGNGVVMANNRNAIAIEQGNFIVRPQDVPLYQIFPCRPMSLQFCLRELHVGDISGHIVLPPS